MTQEREKALKPGKPGVYQPDELLEILNESKLISTTPAAPISYELELQRRAEELQRKEEELQRKETEAKSVQLSIRVSPALRDRFKMCCLLTGKSMQDQGMDLISEWCKKIEQERGERRTL